MKTIFKNALLLLSILPVYGQSVAPLWEDYVKAKQEGKTTYLPDFSFAGYRFSEEEIPDVSGWKHFNVTDYGAVPDDEGYDDEAIQKAVNAAEANYGGGVVYFPPGRYKIAPDRDRNKGIRISKSNIVLKGSGVGAGGTEIFQDSMRIGKRQFHFRPDLREEAKLTVITGNVPRETFWVQVADASVLKKGQNVVIRHQSEQFTRMYFDSLKLVPEWTRLFGEKGGMNIAEIHTIEKIEGNRVRFKNPLHFDLKTIPGTDFELYSHTSIKQCGIEDILFSGNWNSYPEEFKHHKDGIHDSGWCAVSMEYVEDSWVRNCIFRDINEGIFMRAAYKTTVQNVTFSGKKGHSTVHARGGYGVLIKHCNFNAGTHHGPGTGYGGVGTVVTQCSMQTDQNIDSHSGQPYATLFDDVQGGIFKNIGGPHPGFPHHGKYLVFWNFRHSSTFDFHYKFWNTEKRKNHTFARPVFVGFRADRKIIIEDEGLNQLPGKTVSPVSLFEAQLNFRLQNTPGDKKPYGQ
ncbi:DUF4955 domain-containing protein [Sinomicrobium weinanense]|uniref:DUF4955 domain-containing protein n=1 Tax=Sinomicrobium weinanense TaxID=2842200 RepID=A0A926Q5P5_9FLAO|nr:DUF4955 domain-containing protein [Sinomicrobium weinanense]MBC9798205.1 DUF4955 domain-containing protein [Sinomicrobium weinanense]MBU3123301.1 DUF4955 domain-containing protein [Sinomicrobium weinanense]